MKQTRTTETITTKAALEAIKTALQEGEKLGIKVSVAISDNMLTNIPGGIPLRFNGVLVGGMGIAGGTVEQDAAVASAALKALSADLT